MRFILFSILFLAVNVCVAQMKTTYENKSPNYTIKFPDDWKQEIKEGGRLYLMSPVESDEDNFMENINIGYQLNKGNTKIAELDKQYESMVEYFSATFDDFKLISHKIIKVNNENIFELVYEAKLKTGNASLLHFTQWFSVKKDYLFTTTLTEVAGTDKWHMKAMEIMNSLKFN